MTTITLPKFRSQQKTQTHPNLIILGIDPGYARCGVGVVQSDSPKPKALTYGCITSDSHDPTSKRLGVLFSRLESLVQQYRPSIIAVETLFFHNNSKTAMGVSEVRGIIYLAAHRANLHTIDLTPPEVKCAISGNGLADKLQIQRLVSTILSLAEIPKPDDAADALAIAIAAESKIYSQMYGLSF